MKFKEFLKSFYVNVKEGISRFLVAFICSMLFFLTLSYDVIFATFSYDFITPLCMTYALVAVFSVMLKVAQEYITDKITPVIQYVLSAAAGVTAFILIKYNFESLYMIMAYTGVIIAIICFIFFVIMRGENSALAFPRLVSSLVFTTAICGILTVGILICIAAFQLLIFTWDNIYKLYLIVSLFIWVICFINIFLSFIPKKDVPAPQSKIFRSFVLFAGLPLYILLIAILLLYLGKIVITQNMPIGEINWFASFASLFFIFFLLSVMQYDQKLAKLYVKYGGYFLLPVLIMQAIAVFERINAYGLTTPRTVSLVLIIISVLFIACSLIKPKCLNLIALVSGIIVLIVTVTPLNIIDIPIKSQTDILKTILIKNDMLKDGQIVPNPNVSGKDAQRIISAFEYLKYDAKKLPDFVSDSDKSYQEIFGFTNNYDSDIEESNSIYHQFVTKDSVDITDFDKMVKCYTYDDVLKFEHNGQNYRIDLKELGKALYDTYGTSNEELDIYKIDENVSLYFKSLSCEIDGDEVVYCYFDGYALLKD